MTEFGAEGRPDMADKPADLKGSYAFQEQHVDRTLDVVDRQSVAVGRDPLDAARVRDLPRLAAAAPMAGAGETPATTRACSPTRAQRKPAWNAVREHYARTPLYP